MTTKDVISHDPTLLHNTDKLLLILSHHGNKKDTSVKDWDSMTSFVRWSFQMVIDTSTNESDTNGCSWVKESFWSHNDCPQLQLMCLPSALLSPTVASSSAEHDLHSNWVLRVPRVAGDSKQKEVHVCAKESVSKKKNKSGSTSSRLRLQRNPIHLPKVVASAFQTLRFKPKLKKQWSLMGIRNHRHCHSADEQLNPVCMDLHYALLKLHPDN